MSDQYQYRKLQIYVLADRSIVDHCWEPLTEESKQHISALKNVDWLSLESTAVSIEDIEWVTSFPLEFLNISETQVDSRFVERLDKITCLEILHANRLSCNKSKLLKSLAKLKTLRALELDGYLLSVADVRNLLLELPSLETLVIRDSGLVESELLTLDQLDDVSASRSVSIRFGPKQCVAIWRESEGSKRSASV